MPNKSQEQPRKKLYEEYEDSLFKLLMHDAAEIEGQLFLDEREKLKQDPEFLPSQAVIQKFSQQLDAHLHKPKSYARRKQLWQALNKVAIAMLIVMIVLGTTVVTVQAVRVSVLNFLMDIQPEYTSFELKNHDIGKSKNIDWHEAYVPTYIPAGFEVSAFTSGEFSKNIEFKNPQGLLITYTELSEGNKLELDTENASAFKTVSINGHEGSIIVKNSLVTVIWPMNNRMFMIRGQTDIDTAIKIAEEVKFID